MKDLGVIVLLEIVQTGVGKLKLHQQNCVNLYSQISVFTLHGGGYHYNDCAGIENLAIR